LGEEIAVEASEPFGGGVGNVDVGDLAAGQGVHLFAVGIYPGEVAQLALAGHGNDGHFTRGLAVGVAGDGDHGLLAGGPLEEPVDIVGGGQIFAVDGEQVLALFHAGARLQKRRAQLGIPAFAAVDPGELVAVVV